MARKQFQGGVAPLVDELGDGSFVPVVQLHSMPAAVGQGAEDAVSAGNAVRVGGRVRTSAPTSFVAGDAMDLTLAGNGALAVRPFSVPEADWQYAAPVGGITVATAVTMKAAAAAGLRNYVTGLDIHNASTTVSAEVFVLDGAAVIWRSSLPPGGRLDRSFLTPLKGTAATALNVQASAAGQVYVNAQGYVAA